MRPIMTAWLRRRYLEPRYSFLKVQLLGVALMAAGMVVGIYYLANDVVLPRLWAATSPWTQTDWSGGDSPDVVTGATTNWTSLESIEATASAGEITLAAKSDWYSTSWSYRKKITFDNTAANLGTSAETLTDFPVLVKLEGGSDIDYSKTQDNGEDLRFTDSDGTTLLAYEIEEWNEAGTSYVWVKVPSIDAESDTDSIYMYYGNASASDAQNASEVWTDNYALVYHFNESAGSGTVADGTGNTSGSVMSGTALGQGGQISTAVNFASSNGGISLGSVGTPTLTADTTVSFWINMTNYSSPGRQNPFGQAYGGWGTMTIETNGYIHWYFGSNGSNGSPYGSHGSSAMVSNGQWIQVTGVRDSSDHTYKWYKNGAYLNGGTYNSSYPVIATRTFSIGDDYVNHVNGKMDEFRVQQTARSAAWIAASYHSETDDWNSFGSEESKYATSGYLVSSILNAEFPADWGAITYTWSGSGTVTVKARTQNDTDFSDAPAWSSCTALASGDDLVADDPTCNSDTDQYVQYYVELTPAAGSAPVVTEVSLAFSASDQVAPTTNASGVSMTGINDGAWTNTEPTLTWTAGADDAGGNGLAGYCVALDEASLGSSSLLDPETAAGVLTGIDDGVTNNSGCPYIVAGTSFDLSAVTGLSLTSNKQYYFSIKAVDLAGNVYSGASGTYQDLVSFKYDATAPSNPTYISLPGDFIATKSATIVWPTTGSDQATDGESGVAGMQYRIGAEGTWYGDTHNGAEDLTDLLSNDGSYSTQQDPDFASISEGSNVIYFRTLDNVGNSSTAYLQAALKINTTSPSTVQNLAVSPSTNTTNSYAFSWDAPGTYTGQVGNMTYCYTVNTLPSAVTCSFTGAGVTSLAADAFATQPGTNTLYVVAKDEAGNINYDTYASVEFTYSGSAPGIPQTLDIADVSVKATSSWKLALSWEEPADVGAGVSTYKVYHSTDGTSYSLESSVTGISYVDTNLTQTTHYYKIKACDSANSCGAYTEVVSLYPDGKFTTAANLVSGPTVSGVTTKRATISWTTDRASDSKVSYGTSSGSYYDEEPSKSTQETSHSIVLTNLSPGTTYYYKAKWTDEDGNTGTSDELSFQTDAAPTVAEVLVSSIGLDTALITYTTTNASKVKIYYGKTTTFGGIAEVTTATAETTYSTQLSGLEDGTKYYYKINTFDTEDEEYEGTTLTFETLPRPRIANVRLQQVRGTSSSTVLVTWTTNTPVSSIVTYYPSANPAGAQDKVDVKLTTTHRALVAGMLSNTAYTLVVKGRDKVGNEATGTPQNFTTATDTRPPLLANLKIEPVIQGVGEEAVAQLVVSWDTDEAATSQVVYGEGSSGSLSSRTQLAEAKTFNHVVVVPGLRPGAVYHLRALSKDKGDNEAESVDTVVITPKATKSALNLVVSNLSQAFGFLGGLAGK